LSFTLAGGAAGEEDLHVMLNMWDETVHAAVPLIPGKRWYVVLDTARPPPRDIVEPERQEPHAAPIYAVQGRSVAVVEARAIG
jgi:pullulanase/glycogen debranching enzyme